MNRKKEVRFTLFGTRFDISAEKLRAPDNLRKKVIRGTLFGMLFRISAERAGTDKKQKFDRKEDPAAIERLKEAYKRSRLRELEQLLVNANYKRGDRLTASELEQLANTLKEMVDRIKNAGSERSGQERSPN